MRQVRIADHPTREYPYQILFAVEYDRLTLPTNISDPDALCDAFSISPRDVKIYDRKNGHGEVFTGNEAFESIDWRQARASWSDILQWLSEQDRALTEVRLIANFPRSGVHTHIFRG